MPCDACAFAVWGGVAGFCAAESLKTKATRRKLHMVVNPRILIIRCGSHSTAENCGA